MSGPAYGVCFMAAMSKRVHLIAVVVALLVAAQPLLHTHPLDGDNPARSSAAAPCAVCATGTGRLPVAAPSVAAPLTVLYTVDGTLPAAVAAPSAAPRSSRAPPAAA